MARFTSIGMPRKTFVASAAEETNQAAAADDASGSGSGVTANATPGSSSEEAPKKKTHRSEDGGKGKKFDRKRKAEDAYNARAEARGEVPGEGRAGGWGRDASIASTSKLFCRCPFGGGRGHPASCE